MEHDKKSSSGRKIEAGIREKEESIKPEKAANRPASLNGINKQLQ
ncbi:hypothetical protein [Paenibacillus sp. R14(2021)]|nr:hypothetical protein [Paenibacillus sp. R14(2021)]